MYSNEQLIKLLKKNLKSETNTIFFYLDNLRNLNYADNNEKITPLILDSFTHADMITRVILELEKNQKGTVDKKSVDLALKEEIALEEIYAYEIEKTDNPAVKGLFRELREWEQKHEKIVRMIK
jgi:rubrerythrin